jgi:hypothetical protein
MTAKQEWDIEELSTRFLRNAERADLRQADCRRRISYSPGHKRAHDEALAEFYVYHRLHGRTFLATPEDLITELRSMKTLDFKSHCSAYDPECFEQTRLLVIDELLLKIEEKKKQLDFAN